MPLFFGRKERVEEGVRRTRETWFGRLSHLFHGGQVSAETWEDLEEALVSADVGVATAEAVLQRARERVRSAGEAANSTLVLQAVKEEMVALLGEEAPSIKGLLEAGDSRPKPLVVLVVGVNGSGKTTTIAKLTRFFQESGDKVVLGAADTFRAAAIDQLQAWAKRLDVEVIAHQPGSDPAAVAFDAVQAAKARGADVVIIDTAGRLHTKSNLMEELKKVRRVVQRLDSQAPHLTLLVMDATTGQNGLAQARAFTQAVACDGVFLAKLDGTAKGGAVFAIRQELGLPVLFIGTGEGAEDISPFDPSQFVEALFTPLAVDSRA
ncbi:MAG: signal recognition particle-docking protein FtsY [Dehalococcoidia bacterium]|nr:signal recognition particle-docking protein FtsY [Dehalococcoidia bacterium]